MGAGAGLEGLGHQGPLSRRDDSEPPGPRDRRKPGGAGGRKRFREEEISTMSSPLPTCAQVAFCSIVLGSFCSPSPKSLTLSPVSVHAHTHTDTHTHRHTPDTHRPPHVQTQTQPHIHRPPPTDTQKEKHTHRPSDTDTNRLHTNADPPTHTHMHRPPQHTHTHTQLPRWSLLQLSGRLILSQPLLLGQPPCTPAREGMFLLEQQKINERRRHNMDFKQQKGES